jgi:hypothetical protein
MATSKRERGSARPRGESDQKAVDARVADFNPRPLEERERFLEAYEDL